MSVLVFTPSPGARLEYALELALGEVLNSDFEVTDELARFDAWSGPKINYSDDVERNGKGTLHIAPEGLLSERTVRTEEPETGRLGDGMVPFPNATELGFDALAGIFWMVSRMEEYAPHPVDQHGRFDPRDCVSMRMGWITRPVAERWAIALGRALERCSTFTWTLSEYKFVTTIDVDSAYAYRHKGLMRTLGGFAKDLMGRDWANFKARARTLMGQQADPFDTYDRFSEIHRRYGAEVVWFFLLADYGMNDKGVTHRSPNLQRLIRGLADHDAIGLHPGYQSHASIEKLDTEMERLRKISRRDVVRTRQHFLLLHFPDSYRRLVERGVLHDHTMGHAKIAGFRSGMSRSYRHFDLEKSCITPLRIHPFVAMDATLNHYMGLSPDGAVAEVERLRDEVAATGGTLRILWHNESVADLWGWKGWTEVYEELIRRCVTVDRA
ncbi:MAG: polysaccharide deacetylase family protein [Flavobacteriales bacterium]|nr:polysaccharide deacetylase family protein [Flavobacteriales bacterium]